MPKRPHRGLTHGNSIRVVVWFVSSLAMCSLVNAKPNDDAAQEVRSSLPNARAFLADSALVPFGGELRAASTPQTEEAWLHFALMQPGQDAGRLAIDPLSNRVVRYDAGRLAGPVPDTTLPYDQLQTAANAFVHRQAPELFAAGLYRLVTVADTVSELGDRRYHFQAVASGTRLPARAEVGVRVFDGKVSWYRLDASGLGSVATPRLDLDAARAAMLRSLPGGDQAKVWWLDGYREHLALADGWHVGWILTAEIQPPHATRPDFVEELQRSTVDAVSGNVLASQRLKLDGDLFRWYRQHGGEHLTHPSWMRPKPEFTDSAPRWSPDGKQILFLSTRSRPGWPAWLRRGRGLFVMDPEGTNLRCLIREPTWHARWSPDGQSVVAAQGDAVVLLDLGRSMTTRFEAQPDWQYQRAERLADGRVVALACRHRVEYRLHFLDPNDPAAKPAELRPWGDRRTMFGDIQAEPGGGLLVTVGTDVRQVGTNDEQRGKQPWSLYRLKPAQADAAPMTLADYLAAATHLGPAPGGKLLVGRHATHWYLFDPATGTDAPWPVQRVPLQPTGNAFADVDSYSLGDLCFAPGGDRVLFTYLYWSGMLDSPSAEVIWLADADGRNAKPLTLPGTAE